VTVQVLVMYTCVSVTNLSNKLMTYHYPKYPQLPARVRRSNSRSKKINEEMEKYFHLLLIDLQFMEGSLINNYYMQ